MMIAVAGHICIDFIPGLPQSLSLEQMLVPGRLLTTDSATMSVGGMANTALALHRLGMPVRLLGKVGDDVLGDTLLRILQASSPKLANHMLVRHGETTSYTIVLNPYHTDRIFLHHPGANETFCAQDIDLHQLGDVDVFHFGYPTTMRCLYRNDGQELQTILASVKDLGVITSVDMTLPDAFSESGQTDWQAVLRRVLPFVDIFAPSFEEILFMMDGRLYEESIAQFHSPFACLDAPLLNRLSNQLLEWGAAVVAIKLGVHGLYLHTSSNPQRVGEITQRLGCNTDEWTGRELLGPSFVVDVAGTTGAGDCAVAGLLTGLTQGMCPEETITLATAVGACSVEGRDATSGVASLEIVENRINQGWEKRPSAIHLSEWRWNAERELWYGPDDKHSFV